MVYVKRIILSNFTMLKRFIYLSMKVMYAYTTAQTNATGLSLVKNHHFKTTILNLLIWILTNVVLSIIMSVAFRTASYSIISPSLERYTNVSESENILMLVKCVHVWTLFSVCGIWVNGGGIGKLVSCLPVKLGTRFESQWGLD